MVGCSFELAARAMRAEHRADVPPCAGVVGGDAADSFVVVAQAVDEKARELSALGKPGVFAVKHPLKPLAVGRAPHRLETGLGFEHHGPKTGVDLSGGQVVPFGLSQDNGIVSAMQYPPNVARVANIRLLKLGKDVISANGLETLPVFV